MIWRCGISSKCINPIIDTLVTPITYIINLSLREGVFPCELKIAQVLPLYKNNDPMLFNNYRPISLLPFFSKVFERLMYNRLIDFIEKHHLLYQFQFGFHKNHSTFMALVILLETRQIWGIWKLRLAYSPETPNLGQIQRFLKPCDLEIWRMTLKNNRAPLLCYFKLYASFRSHR